jgi:hypothetical protein
MKLRDFVCDNQHTTEELYKLSETIPESIPCPICKLSGKNKTAFQVKMYPSPGVRIDGSSTDFNGK